MYRSPKNQESFEISVWETVRKIPRGCVVTYGQLANMIPLPEGEDEKTYRAFGPRWVGSAMARSPNGIPWHRVINSQGKISQREDSAVRRQREKLEAEGVLFDDRDKVDLKTYQWQPQEQDRP